MQLQYWSIVAKNIAPAVALELGGFDWEMGAGPGSKGTGDLWGEWLEMKHDTVWAYLPNLILADGTKIGTELSIMQYLARKNPSLAGADDKEFLVSQDLLHQAEELYQKFAQKVPTVMAQDKSAEEYQKFINGADKDTHSNAQGLQVYLAQFEDYFTKVGGKDGKFTSSGMTIGEIKLFVTLQLLVMVKADALSAYTNLSKFVSNFTGNGKVAAILEGKARNMTPLAQYFIAPP